MTMTICYVLSFSLIITMKPNIKFNQCNESKNYFPNNIVYFFSQMNETPAVNIL